ncbi:hypothetical protein Moror_14017 [Moniliophthora roreri MCA 2997]|uniref:Uncharacterized protein n=1 Tax=Moniliophthora roreri (strain MCA 2997) TaxID=1381753 RepID=V2XMN9_MONRO|nr:hypothetical protein Moror_14017 [Moniliophthora roreri MCA 2997]
MGGSAFKFLPTTAFPRLPPPLYQSQKARFLRAIQGLYVHVLVPHEGPEKESHGDIDFLVCTPRDGNDGAVDVPHQIMQEALGALHVVPMEGNRTSNFAVPIGQEDRHYFASSINSEDGPEDLYYQVDVHVCNDKEELERIFFFHSYGDLGMILGLLAQNVGLALGTNGLKYPHPPHPTIVLSTSYDEIADFFGLDMGRWHAGFKTHPEIFDWVASSRFFDPSYFRSGLQKVKPERAMYFQFTRWAESLERRNGTADEVVSRRREQVREEALVRFNRKEEVAAYYRQYNCRQMLKEAWNGHRVSQWTGLGERWKAVKQVMDGVREANGGNEGLARIIEVEGEEGIRQRVMNVFDRLGLKAS